jgi:hypothetical protein
MKYQLLASRLRQSKSGKKLLKLEVGLLMSKHHPPPLIRDFGFQKPLPVFLVLDPSAVR